MVTLGLALIQKVGVRMNEEHESVCVEKKTPVTEKSKRKRTVRY